MVELDLEGRVVTLAVAQKPFDKESAGGFSNTFSTLVPVVYDDGSRANPADFPAKQDVWWMIRSGGRALAEPGRLVTGTLERSQQVGHPDKAHYQVRVESVEPARSAQLTEILELLPDEIKDVRELASQAHPLTVDHPPLDQVFVRWRGHLYGPLRTTASPSRDRDGLWLVQLSPAHPDSYVLQVPDQVLGKVPSGRSHHIDVDVSLNNYPPYHHFRQAHLCRYFLIPREDFQAVVPAASPRLVLENEQAVINRAAKKVFSRKKRQDLIHLLAELDGGLGNGPVDAADVIRSLGVRLGDEEKEAEALARALLESGAMDDRLSRAQEQAAQEHVEKHAALLQTRAEERVVGLRKELVALEKRKETVADEVETLRRDRLAAVEGDLEAKRREFDVACQKEREKLDGQARELDRQREVLSKNLAQVSNELATNRDGLVNQFLAISPLLSQLNLVAAGPRESAPSAVAPSSAPAPAEARPARVFVLPAFVQGGAPGRDVREVGFFERFCKHVEASGFKHRRIDLAAFHLSVKCNDLTVLGGLPGTGKSSLPRLYAEALAGDEHEDGLRRYLHVGVSPSWLDMRDVLGHTNALDRCFQPAESGLYQHLVYAQEEEKQRGADSRLYLVCLDEMNLAQVEHYFSGFIQALERPHGMREVRCFSPEIVGPTDPFAAWPTLNLPRTLRFVGTVNFDETTRQLSQRVLDRANLIRLHPSPLLDAKDPAPTRSLGPAVTLRNYRDWIDPSPRLDRSLGELIDKLREPLGRLGCPLNPRRFNAVRKFVGSAPPEVCKPEQALDLQIAQRVLPQVRNLFRPGAQEALDAIKKTLESHPLGFPESLQSLEEMADSDYPADLLAEGAGE
jgi:hypothetical protein